MSFNQITTQNAFQDQFAMIRIADELKQENEQRYTNAFQEFTNEMKKNFALLHEDNRIYKEKAETAETNAQMLKVAHVQAIETNTDCIKTLTERLNETNQKFNNLQEELELYKLYSSNVQPSQVFLELHKKVKENAEKVIASDFYKYNKKDQRMIITALLSETFDKSLLNASPLEATTQIKPWLEARDLLIMQRSIVELDFTHLKTMKDLILEASKFSTWFQAQDKSIANLRTLSLRNKVILDVPHQICLLKNLTSLNLTNNKLNAIPAKVINLIQLKILKLDTNPITELPVDITKLENLENLSIYNGQLVLPRPDLRFNVIPKEIGNLTTLVSLNLGANRLKTIPPEISNLQNLKSLNIQMNVIQWLPKEITNLTKLDFFSNCS